LEQNVHGEAARTAKKTLFLHPKVALEKLMNISKTSDRGKLIMGLRDRQDF